MYVTIYSNFSYPPSLSLVRCSTHNRLCRGRIGKTRHKVQSCTKVRSPIPLPPLIVFIIIRIITDPRFERLPCLHKGTYADDCIVNRVTQHRCYIVATCDRDLKRRLRKIPGVPIMYISQHRYSIERMPDAFGGK